MASKSHSHSELAGESLVNAARDALIQAGEQWTDMRSAVFRALAGRDRPASAYDIADEVGSARGKRVAPNSVYRILDLFVRANLVSRIESANAFMANSHPGCRHDCIFMICQACGLASHLDDDRLTSALREAGASKGFAELRPVVELVGRCRDCAA